MLVGLVSTMNLSLPFRPIEESDAFANGMLIKASVSDVESALANMGAQITQNVYGQKIPSSGLLVLKIRDQQWTTLLPPSQTVIFNWKGSLPEIWSWELHGQILSVRLNTRVIWYETGDGSAWISYVCWDNGRLIEWMAHSEDEIYNKMSKEEIQELERRCEEDPEFVRPDPPHLFFSVERPNLHREDIHHSYVFMGDFLTSQQTNAFFHLYDLKRDDFEQLDYAFWPEN